MQETPARTATLTTHTPLIKGVEVQPLHSGGGALRKNYKASGFGQSTSSSRGWASSPLIRGVWVVRRFCLPEQGKLTPRRKAEVNNITRDDWHTRQESMSYRLSTGCHGAPRIGAKMLPFVLLFGTAEEGDGKEGIGNLFLFRIGKLCYTVSPYPPKAGGGHLGPKCWGWNHAPCQILEWTFTIREKNGGECLLQGRY